MVASFCAHWPIIYKHCYLNQRKTFPVHRAWPREVGTTLVGLRHWGHCHSAAIHIHSGLRQLSTRGFAATE